MDHARRENHIRTYRLRRGLSLEALAVQVDMSRASLARKERGESPVQAHEKTRLAAALQIREETLFPADSATTDGGDTRQRALTPVAEEATA